MSKLITYNIVAAVPDDHTDPWPTGIETEWGWIGRDAIVFVSVGEMTQTELREILAQVKEDD